MILILSVFCFLFFNLGFCDSTSLSPQLMREILLQYGYTDKDSAHSYIEPYSEILEKFRNKKCNLLEIGVSGGGSAFLWHEFLPLSRLFLLDNRDCLQMHIRAAMDNQRFGFYVRDAYSMEVVNEMQNACPEGFDIIIEDGAHTLPTQIFVLNHYLKLLRKGGVLVIEDIQDINYLDQLKKCVDSKSEYSIETIDLRSVKNRFDDVLFVVTRSE